MRKKIAFEISWIFFFTAAAVLFSFYALDRSFWLDEAISIVCAKMNFLSMVLFLRVEPGAPLYFFLLSIWIKIFGTGEVWVRSFSALIYCLNIPAIYILAKTIYNRRTAFVSSVLFLISPLAVNASQRARPYALLCFLVTISIFFFYKEFFHKKSSKQFIILYFITNALGMFTHYWFAFILGAQFLSIVFFQRALLKRFMIALLISIVPFMFWIPIFWQQLNNPSLSWFKRPPLYDLLRAFILWDCAIAIVSLLLLFVYVRKYRTTTLDRTRSFALYMHRSSKILVIFFLSSLLIPYCISQVKPIFIVGRYTIIALPPGALLFGRLIDLSLRKSLVIVLSVVLILYGFVMEVIPRQIPAVYSDKLTAQYLVTHAKKGDIIIFTGPNQATIGYYLDRLAPPAAYIQFVFPDEMNQHLAYEDVRKLEDKNYLEGMSKEAEQLTERISLLPHIQDKTLWFFDGFYMHALPETEILKEKLERKFLRVKKVDLRSQFFSQVLVYKIRNFIGEA